MWNYRLIRRVDEKEIYITEVYYDKLYMPDGWINPNDLGNFIYGETREEIVQQVNMLKQALTKPIIIVDGDKILREEIV